MKGERVALSVILLSASLTVMAGSIIAPILNLIRDSLSVPSARVGLIITTHGLFMAIFSPVMGSLIDRKGVKWVYIVTLICYGIAGGSGLLIQSFWVLLFSRALLGIALAGIFTAINVLILNMFSRKERDKVMGWRGSAQSVGGILWPLTGGALGGLSWHLPFSVYTLGIPLGIAAIFAIPKEITPEKSVETTGKDVSVFKLMREVSALPVILVLMFSSNVLLYVVVIFLPQRLDTIGITSSMLISLFIACMTTASAIVSFFYGRLRKKQSYQSLIVIGTFIWAVSFVGLLLATSPVLIAVSASIFGLGSGIIMPTVMAWVGDIVPIEFRGRISSYLGSTGFIGQFASPILFAPVLIYLGLNGVFLTGLAIAACWFLFNLIYARRTAQ